LSVILGAGLTGLSYAYGELKKKNSSVIILEESKEIGGLMRTFDFDGFLFDFAPHIFRSKDEKTMKFTKNLLGHNYHQVSSNPAIFKRNQFFENVIPSVTHENLEKLPSETKEKVTKELKNLPAEIDLSNFKNCIASQIGETLYWQFFGEYSRKWWGVDPKNLSSDLAPKNLAINRSKSYGHITTDFERLSDEIYPTTGGIFEIAKALERSVKSLGGKISANSKIKGLECDGDEIARLILEKDREETEIDLNSRLVISTIPLTSLCEMSKIENDLAYRGDICVFLKLNGKKVFDSSWVYFHDSDVIFGRIHEPSYYSVYHAPRGYTSFCVEVTCFQNDSYWNDAYLGEKVIQQLVDLGIIRESQEPAVLGVEKYGYAYPIHTVDYKQKLKEVFDKLSSLKNLKVIGRTGSFGYLNMWECLKWAVY
jgi:protoporphyrinogen oxidase